MDLTLLVLPVFIFWVLLPAPASPLAVDPAVRGCLDPASSASAALVSPTRNVEMIPSLSPIRSPVDESPTQNLSSRRSCLSLLAAASTTAFANKVGSASATGEPAPSLSSSPTEPGHSSSATDENRQPIVDDCDEACKEDRRHRIEDRRAMMRQSRSSTSRQDVFDLSRQRAKLYGTDYRGATCLRGIPCL